MGPEELRNHLRREPPHPVPVRRKADPQTQTQTALTPGAPLGVQRAAMLDLQRTAGNASTASLVEDDDPAADVRSVVESGGQPLDRDTRSFMESRLGADFSGVRVHTDAGASQSAQRLSAQAYTVGEDIVFGQGHYTPDTDSGKRVLAHELTHVVQQRSGPVSGTAMAGGVKVSDPSDAFEQAAEHSAERVMSSADAATPVQREGLPEEEELQASWESVQREGLPEEEELQASWDSVQREGLPEEEELQASWESVQRQEISEEEAEEEELTPS